MVTSSGIMERLDASSNFRFEVKVDGIDVALFSEVQLPTLQLDTTPIKEGGQNGYTHKLPVRVDVGTVTLKHGVARGLNLLNWYLEILQGDVRKAKRTVSITMYDVAREPVLTLQFGNALPVKWSGPSLDAGGNAVAIDQLEFAYHEFTLDVG